MKSNIEVMIGRFIIVVLFLDQVEDISNQRRNLLVIYARIFDFAAFQGSFWQFAEQNFYPSSYRLICNVQESFWS